MRVGRSAERAGSAWTGGAVSASAIPMADQRTVRFMRFTFPSRLCPCGLDSTTNTPWSEDEQWEGESEPEGAAQQVAFWGSAGVRGIVRMAGVEPDDRRRGVQPRDGGQAPERLGQRRSCESERAGFQPGDTGVAIGAADGAGPRRREAGASLRRSRGGGLPVRAGAARPPAPG